MLQRTVLQQNALLATLTEEQLQAIENLSRNDEETVIAKKKKEIYSSLSESVKATSGVAKFENEDENAYLERALKDVKTKADSATALQTQIDELTTSKAELEQKIKDGKGNEELNKQLEDLKTDLDSTKALLVTANSEKETLKSDYDSKLQSYKMDNEISVALSGLDVKERDSEKTKALLKLASDKVKGMNPDFVDDGNGGTKVIYKDKDGVKLINATNGEPLGTSDLLSQELKTFDLVEEGRKAKGLGGKGGNQGGKILISGAKSQDEAVELIHKELAERGIPTGTAEFNEAVSNMWEDNNVDNLPE